MSLIPDKLTHNEEPALASPTGYALGDTAIEKGGVLRCCLSSVALEYEGRTVNIGDQSKCQHCGEAFTLVLVPDGMMTAYRKPKFPVWKPNWQLKGHN